MTSRTNPSWSNSLVNEVFKATVNFDYKPKQLLAGVQKILVTIDELLISKVAKDGCNVQVPFLN